MATVASPGQIYSLVGGLWRCPGRDPVAPAGYAQAKGRLVRGAATATFTAPPANQFVAFTPGTVEPLSFYDEAQGRGIRNVGPRYTPTRYDGDITLTNGQVLQGLDIYGRVYVPAGANNCIIRDCIIRGWTSDQWNSAAADGALIMGSTSYNLKNLTVEWSRIDGTGRESPYVNAIAGGAYTMRYCEITRTTDGISAVQVGDTVIEACRIWNGYYTAWNNSAVSSTAAYPGYPSSPSDRRIHGDCIQVHQLDGWVFRGNSLGDIPAETNSTLVANSRDPQVPAQKVVIDRIDAGPDYPNACMQVGSAVGGASSVGILFEKNWVTGGFARINMSTAPTKGDYLAGVTIRDNLFKRNTAGISIYMSADCQAVITNNTFTDNGAVVPVSTF